MMKPIWLLNDNQKQNFSQANPVYIPLKDWAILEDTRDV